MVAVCHHSLTIRALVTNLRHTPEAVCAHIYARVDSENRTNCITPSRSIAPAVRGSGPTSCVLLRAAASVLRQTLQIAAAGIPQAVAQTPPLRQILLTIGVQMTRTVRRLVLRLPRSHPEHAAWHHDASAIGAT